jgi:hypothetical protein
MALSRCSRLRSRKRHCPTCAAGRLDMRMAGPSLTDSGARIIGVGHEPTNRHAVTVVGMQASASRVRPSRTRESAPRAPARLHVNGSSITEEKV